MARMDVIVADGVTKSFGQGKLALAGVSLEVPAGAAFALIGPNGAGKTTLIKSLLGIVRPSGGRLEVFGLSPDDARARRRIGYVPERLHFAPGATGTSFLASIAALRRLGEVSAEIARLLERVGIAAQARQRVATYSKGMRQRLALAAALLGAPELLVLDEPTDGVDPIGRMHIRGILEEERRRGATLFVNSHLLSEVERLCSRVAIIAHGRIVRQGELATLVAGGGGYLARFAPGAAAETLLSLGFCAQPPYFRFAGDDAAALNAALTAARQAGALLVELKPAGRDLEALLADALEVSA